MSMQLNIFEAVWSNLQTDEQAHEINAYHGLDLVRDLSYEPGILGESNKIQRWFAPHWIKSYIQWNLAFVLFLKSDQNEIFEVSSLGNSPFGFLKLIQIWSQLKSSEVRIMV